MIEYFDTYNELDLHMEEINEVHHSEKPTHEPLFMRRLEARYTLPMSDLAIASAIPPKVIGNVVYYKA